MQRFIQDQNLTFLRRLLADQKEMDERRRQEIFELLAEEEAKQQAATSGAKRCPATKTTFSLEIDQCDQGENVTS